MLFRSQTSESATESVKVMDTPAVRFAHAFAKTDGENVSKLAKDAKVSNAEKPKIIALSYFLYWGSYGGNTINTLLFCKRFSIFGLLFTLHPVLRGPVHCGLAYDGVAESIPEQRAGHRQHGSWARPNHMRGHLYRSSWHHRESAAVLICESYYDGLAPYLGKSKNLHKIKFILTISFSSQVYY